MSTTNYMPRTSTRKNCMLWGIGDWLTCIVGSFQPANNPGSSLTMTLHFDLGQKVEKRWYWGSRLCACWVTGHGPWTERGILTCQWPGSFCPRGKPTNLIWSVCVGIYKWDVRFLMSGLSNSSHLVLDPPSDHWLWTGLRQHFFVLCSHQDI